MSGDWNERFYIFHAYIINGQLERKLHMNYGGVTGFTMDRFGKIGIGTQDPGNYQLNVNGDVNISKAIKFDCNDCGGLSTLFGTDNWGDLTIQGRVLSTNQNLHLSPPGNTKVIINDTYRAAGGTSSGHAGLWVSGETLLAMDGDAVGIGTGSIPTGYLLAVAGKAIMEEVKVEVSGNWPDYVFAEDYNLKSLEETETFIKENNRLPDMPSAEEVAENGIALGEMNRLLLEKVEELTLHLIQLEKGNKNLKTENEFVKSQLSQQLTDNRQSDLKDQVEELGLYNIDQEKRINQQQKVIEQLLQRLQKLEFK